VERFWREVQLCSERGQQDACCSRGVEVGGQAAAALVAQVVRQRVELADKAAAAAPGLQLRGHQLQQQALRLDARDLP
jgi:hypothetical protein